MGRGGSFVPMARNPIDITGANNWNKPLGPILPFDIQFIEETLFTLRPGIVAGFLPDNMFDEISYSGSTVYVWASCTAASGVITAVTLNYGSTTPTPQTINAGTPPSSIKIPICMVQGTTRNTFNFIGANWLTPYPVLAFSTGSGSSITNYYSWRW
jgi:hypothetical protein